MTQLHPSRDRSIPDPAVLITGLKAPSEGASAESKFLAEGLARLARARSPSEVMPPLGTRKSFGEHLYDALAAAKVLTSQVAMHLDAGWRDRLFHRLDNLLDERTWDEADQVLQPGSFSTFLKMMLAIRPQKQPSLGVSYRGYLLADWTTGRDSLVIEYLPMDEVRWVLLRYLEGERETAAGQTLLRRLVDVLSPYEPERWFCDGGN